MKPLISQTAMFNAKDDHIEDAYQVIKQQTLEQKISRSIEVLKEAKKRAGKYPLIINFSGGKDSLTILSLVREITDNVEACYVDGGIDLPETLQYVKDTCKTYKIKLHIPTCGVTEVPHKKGSPLEGCQNFLDYVKFYGYFPTSGRRWCSTWMKQRVMKAYWRTLYGPKERLFKLCGVRMFESSTRLWKYGKPSNFNRHILDNDYFYRPDREHNPCVLVYPIIEWTTPEVRQYLKQKNIVVHDGYKLFGVSGCKWCPVHKPDIYRKILTVHPNIYDDFIAVEQQINRPCVQGGLWLRDIKKEIVK